MFSQRHYVFLAAFIAYERSVSTGVSWDKDSERTKTIDGLARLLATRLEQDNPKFKRARFLDACDVEDSQQQRAAEANKERLEYLRRELRAERISWGELAELQSLAKYIDPGDTELLEAAGVEENPQPRRCDCESETCHPHADCKGIGTVKTIYSTICADCAKKPTMKPYLKENEVR